MTNILGGGQQSRLFTEVRKKRGLAYSVSAGIRNYRKAALLVISTGSANEKVPDTLRVIRNELTRLRHRRSKRAGAGRRQDLSQRFIGAIARQLGPIAGLMQGLQLEGLPARSSEQAAGADRGRQARRCAARRPPRLRDEAMTTVVVGKPAGLSAE
jgi:zinc protease